MEFEDTAITQLKLQYKDEPITSNVYLIADIYYPSKRNDLSPELFFDCLQKAGVLENDRQIWSYSAFKHIDKENPRVICTIYETE